MSLIVKDKKRLRMSVNRMVRKCLGIKNKKQTGMEVMS